MTRLCLLSVTDLGSHQRMSNSRYVLIAYWLGIYTTSLGIETHMFKEFGESQGLMPHSQ